jgi:DNA-binding MarR family transcriptional regulator
VSLYRQGEHSTAELADLVGVARSTVHRAPQRDRVQGVARRRTTADGASLRP